MAQTRQDDAVTRKQAFKAGLGLLIFVALVGIFPATGAYSKYDWKGYWGTAGILIVGVPLLMIGFSYLQPKKKDDTTTSTT